MPLEESTYDLYRSFTRYCRTGEYQGIPGVRTDRVSNYFRLVNNVVQDNLRKAYPITVSVLDDAEWSTLVTDFFSSWDSPAPQLWRMPRELYEYVCQSGYASKLKRPYLEDLLYFEWIEIEVYMMCDATYPSTKKDGDLAKDALVLNAECELLRFDYPIFKFSADQLEAKRGEYFVICFRHPESLNVHFMEVSGLFMRLFHIMQDLPQSATAAIGRLCSELNMVCDQKFEAAAVDFIEALQQQGMIIGFLEE